MVLVRNQTSGGQEEGENAGEEEDCFHGQMFSFWRDATRPAGSLLWGVTLHGAATVRGGFRSNRSGLLAVDRRAVAHLDS